MTTCYDAEQTRVLTDIIGQTAAQVGREMGVEGEDIESELWIWVYDNPDHTTKFLADDAPQLLRFRLRSEARRWALKERAAKRGYNVDDLMFYSLNTIRALLPDIFDYSDWQQTSSPGDGMPKAKSLANTTGDRLAMILDLKTAVSRLPDDQYNCLVWVYKYNYTMQQLGDELGIDHEAAKKRVHRAVRKIQVLLGDARPMDWPQPRAAMSNEAARAIQSGHWDG